jgi:MurNAc alpha-1-phosphate uridylyltransferase
MIKEAMILAAGFGERLRPLTKDCPKPLLEIGEETLLSNTLRFLKEGGINKVVINVHYLSEKIIDYLKNNKFDLSINIVQEKKKILDTGGGVLNTIKYFSKQPFIVINPDTIWNTKYLNSLKKMENFFFDNKKKKCLLLLVNKDKSFDKNLIGDFSLQNNLVTRKKINSLNYIYTGLQIINPNIFSKNQEEVFSINKVWDKLIQREELHGIESNNDFLHVSTFEIYKKIIEKNFKR